MTLSWEVVGARVVELEADALSWAPLGLPVSTASVVTPPLERDTRFTLRASGEGGNSLSTLQVSVVPEPRPPAIERFEVFPDRFDGEGVEVSLAWRAEGSLRLLANDAPLPDFPGDEAVFWQTLVRRPTRFTLVAERAGEQVRAEALVRRSGRELEPNDDRSTAGFLDRNGEATGEITPRDVDWYAVNVPAGGAVWAEVTDGSRGCSFDSQLELWGPDPERPGQIRFITLNDDTDSNRSCALIDPATDGRAVELLEGRHYLSIRGFDARETGRYQLEVRVIEPACGNGLVEVSQGELCDDGDILDGDGCSSVCDVEGAIEVEGPDIERQIPVRFSGFPPNPTYVRVQMVRDGTIQGYFRDSQGRCLDRARIRLLDRSASAGAELRPVGEGDRTGCATLRGRPLRAGSYLLKLTHASMEPEGLVRVRLADPGCGDALLAPEETCDDGNRRPGDGCSPTCVLEAVGTATVGSGAVRVDLPDERPRFVRVSVTAPGVSLTASVSSGPAPDVQLSLHDDRFIELGRAATGAPLDPATTRFANDLGPAVYHLGLTRVRPGPEPVGVRVGEVRPVCPDGRIQRLAGEQCDDGGVVPGDGCNSACQLEVSGPAILVPDPRSITRTLSIPGQGSVFLFVRSSTAASLNMNSGHPTDFRCESPAPDTFVVRLLDESGRLLDEIGPTRNSFLCPRIFSRIGVGDYYLEYLTSNRFGLSPVQVAIFGRPGTCGDFGVDVNEECDDGNRTAGDGCNEVCQFESSALRESEVNDTPDQADALPVRVGDGRVQVLGSNDRGDRDFFVFEVGRWQEVSLSARTRDPRSPRCQADTQLRVSDAAGQVLAANDDDPVTLTPCSRIELGGASRLFEGRYFLEVSPGAAATRVPGYILEVELR